MHLVDGYIGDFVRLLTEYIISIQQLLTLISHGNVHIMGTQ